MDRLSSYATREAESESPQDRQKQEQEATARLLENLRINNENQSPETKTDRAEPQQPNGERTHGDTDENLSSKIEENEVSVNDKPGAIDGLQREKPPKKSRGMPENIKLFEIFYEQVSNLVTAQRLPIQDIVALLVSLSNLAL